MKKILLLLLAVLLAAALPCGSLADEEGDVYGVHWKLDGNATLTFTANGSDGPAMIFEGPWDAFGYKVNAVVFGEGVTDVWASLENLTGLTSVTFGPDVAVIDRCDLSGTSRLKTIVLQVKQDCFSMDDLGFAPAYRPEKIEASEDSCYVAENGLLLTKDGKTLVAALGSGKLRVPDGVTAVRDGAIRYTGYTEVTFPETVTEIGTWAISYNNKLQRLVLPASLTRAGASAFEENRTLKSIQHLGCTLTVEAGEDGRASERIFHECAYPRIDLPPMNFVPRWTCTYNKALATITVGNGTEEIASDAFFALKAIKEIYIPDSVKAIAEDFIQESSDKYTIFCSAGSYAEQFAAAHGIKCKPVVFATGLTLSESSLTLAKGKGASLSGTIAPADATVKKLEWLSSNEAVATVNNGKVKAVAPGECDIVCAVLDGSQSRAVCHVTVE